jgi:bacillithiol synthase
VTTGQQPGLFGGPLYTLGKALTAIELANLLQERTGVPVAPVFWAATDDTDFEEACWTAVAMPGGLEILRSGRQKQPDAVMSSVALGNTAIPLDTLARAAGSVSDPRPIEAARAAYGADTTIGNAYVDLLRTLLEPLGMSVLDASHPCIREAGYPVTRLALERASEVSGALKERHEEIVNAGHQPQVADVPGLSLVFGYDGVRKRRLGIAEAVEWSSSSPERLGPNVLLRPVVERSILPTVAYVAGPAEIAYMAQVTAVADVLGEPRPLGIPRWSGTVMEPHVKRLMQSHNLSMDDVRTPDRAERVVAEGRSPGDAVKSLHAIREHVRSDLSALAASTDLLGARTIEGAQRDMDHRVSRLERRLLAAVKKRELDAMRDIATIRASLMPLGKRQERVLNPLPMLARHGERLWSELRSHAADHVRQVVEGKGSGNGT